MGKKMIFHAIFALIGAIVYFLFFNDIILIDLIVFISVYLLFSLLIEFVLMQIKSKKVITQAKPVDNSQVTAFIEAVGGASNIATTDFESSRVKVVIKDVDLIKQDKLAVLFPNGASLAGNLLQITIGARSSDFSYQVRKAIE